MAGDAIDFTATGGAYYRVRVNGEVVSQHSTKHKALERAVELEIEDPLRVVTVELTESIRVEAPAPVLPAWGAERRSGYERRQADVNNGLRRRVAQRRGHPIQFPPEGSETVGGVAFTTPPDSAMEVSETYQAEVVVTSPPMPVPGDSSLPYAPRTLTGRTVVWSSTNEAVATVADGLVAAVGAGTCDIRATCAGIMVAFTLTVTASAATVDSVEVLPATFTVFEASTQQLAGTPKDASGNAILGLTGSWSSNDTDVATVNASTGLVTGVAAGTCTITFTVDGVPGTSACTVSVAPSGSEFVVFADPKVETILGPLLVSGSTDNPWPQYDTKAAATGLTYGTKAPGFYPVNNPGGTVSITSGSPTLTGSGTTFLTRVALYNRIYITDAGGTVRGPFFASAINSDTSITLDANWPHADVSGVAWKTNGTTSGLTDQQYFDSFTHYYDFGQVLYILYHQTGNTAYRDLARIQTDAWYTGSPNSGVGSGDYAIAPRSGYMAGLMLRALDGRPDMWDFIERWVDYQFNIWLWTRRNNATLHYGVRDGAFCLLYASLLSTVLPDSYRNTADTADINGVTKRAYHLDRCIQMITLYYERLQHADGGFYWDQEDAEHNIGAVTFQWGYVMEAMIVLHKAIRDTPAYATTTTAIENILTALVDCTWTRAWRPEAVPDMSPLFWRGLWYQVYRVDEAKSPSGSGVTGGDPFKINDMRQFACMVVHAFGYVYHLTSDPKYLTQGDEIFSALYGFGSGPAADSRGCLLDSFDNASYNPPAGRVRAKEFNQAVRSAGRYLARRAGSTD